MLISGLSVDIVNLLFAPYELVVHFGRGGQQARNGRRLGCSRLLAAWLCGPLVRARVKYARLRRDWFCAKPKPTWRALVLTRCWHGVHWQGAVVGLPRCTTAGRTTPTASESHLQNLT